MRMGADCLFCRIVSGEIPATKVYEDESVVAFADINPQAPVHALVIPRRHVENVAALDAGDGELIAGLMLAAARVAREAGVEEAGYRLVLNVGPDGGQTVGHLHVHLLGGRGLGWPPG
jgi:histidine triad (HIT) family protein